MTFQKTVGLIVIFMGALTSAVLRDWEWLEWGESAGLMIIFFAKERVDDERVQQLKLKAMLTALCAGYGFSFFTHPHLIAKFLGREVHGHLPYENITISQFLAGVFLIAIAHYYFWHWQDGRAATRH